MLNPVQKFIWNKREVTVILPKNYFKSNMKNYPALITQDGDYIFKRYAFTCSPEVIFIGLTPLDRNIEYTPWDTTTDVGDYTGEADKYLKCSPKRLSLIFMPNIALMKMISVSAAGLSAPSSHYMHCLIMKLILAPISCCLRHFGTLAFYPIYQIVLIF